MPSILRLPYASLALLALAIGACVGSPATESDTYAEGAMGDLLGPADGKADTGYYSSLATELEGEFRAVLELDVSSQDAAARQGTLERLQDNPTVLRLLADQQLKLAKGQLNADKLHLNLSGNDIEVSDLALDGDVIRASYSVRVETLVTYKELQAEGVAPESLVDREFPVSVAADPRDLMARYGTRCASGFTEGSLNENNYFYYFDPQAEGCDVPLAPSSSLRVRSMLPTTEAFPEYDRLVADGRIEAAIVFGQAEEGAVHGGDWGVMMWRTFAANLRTWGFKGVDGLEVGQRYERKAAGLTQWVDLVSPWDLETLAGDTDALFAELLQHHEVIMYNGHSFYGSLGALDDPANFPADTYQVIFMNSCWSYEYYTKQVFRHKATEADPQGWALADVVNNTTYAWFSRMEQGTSILLANLLAGAESLGVDGNGRRFTWQHIVGVLNDEAQGVCPVDADPMDCRHYQPRKAHEMYGVSGVTTNAFLP